MQLLKKNKKKIYAYLFFFMLLGAFIIVTQIIFFSEIRFAVPDNGTICKNKNAPVILSNVGDLLIGTGRTWRQIVNDDYGPNILGDYFEILKKGDLVFANFEGIISQGGEPRLKNLPAQFSLRTDPAIVSFIKHLNNKIILSFANNHSADFGHDAIYNSINLLEKSDVDYVGIGRNLQEVLTPHIVKISGMRVAFLAFTDLLPKEFYASDTKMGVAELTDENLRTAIRSAKQSSDFVIVSLHTARDIAEPFSFWPDQHQKLFYRLAVDYGADVVVGQHSHGLQWAERYRGKLIFYSLGLFLYDPFVSQRYKSTDPLFSATQFKGGGILTLKICQDGVHSFDLTPTEVIYRDKRLVIVPASFFTRLLTRLTTLRLNESMFYHGK